MPIRVRYQNTAGQDCMIRPTPFIAITEQILKNAEGKFGVTYNITLTGTLLPADGMPYALNSATDSPFDFFENNEPAYWGGDFIGPYGLFDNVPISQRDKPGRQVLLEGNVATVRQSTKLAAAILSKQRALRALFAQDGQRVELTDILDNAGATIICYPRVNSVDFSEGPYLTKTEYTINLEADYLLRGNFDDDQLYVDVEGIPNSGQQFKSEFKTISDVLDHKDTAFIQDYSESWGIEADDAVGESVANPRSYRISHNLSATGKQTFVPQGVGLDDKEIPAWEQARNFVLKKLANQPSGSYPNIKGQIGSGTMNLVKSYGGYNHVRTENIDVTAGSYSVAENWLLSSGTSTENFNMSTSTSNSDPFISVQIDGSIKGLSQIPPLYKPNDADYLPDDGQPSGLFGSSKLTAASGAYANALKKYNQVSNSGRFGLTSDLYKRANNMVAVELNSQPISVSLQTNQYTGEIGYSLQFNNRPVNIISGVIAEAISVNDTYPGDVFATIPVLGRKTGPVLQYIGGRTEYRRDVSINLTMDYTKIPYGSGRSSLILKKPSLVEPTASQIAELIGELSPANEPGVRKWFIAPPSESWNPKEGTYSFNISWTYELDR